MYVLTLKQPWAWLVVHGPKDIENRTWVDRRVALLVQQQLPFLLHAAAGETGIYYREELAKIATIDPSVVVPPRDELARGALIGRAKIARLLAPGDWDPDLARRLRGPHRWHLENPGTPGKGQYGWILKERRALPVPVPCKGTLGLWKLSPKVLAELERKVGA